MPISNNQINNNIQKRKFDLEERTFDFAKKILTLCKNLPPDPINKRLIDQIVRSGTSVGANYREANETDTKKDFRNRIRICRKEAKETHYWLKIITEANPAKSSQIEPLIKESIELVKIFAAIGEKSK